MMETIIQNTTNVVKYYAEDAVTSYGYSAYAFGVVVALGCALMIGLMIGLISYQQENKKLKEKEFLNKLDDKSKLTYLIEHR